ncbi:MAG TPA: murein biosynthesis integral membrane protein MurJ [Pyrinomonadaceae bacterium]|jgi:putative peptidoglycan lipid II flippase
MESETSKTSIKAADQSEITVSVTVNLPNSKPEKTEFKLTPKHNRLQVGRERQNEIWIDYESISRFHASLLMKPDGRLLIADLDSTAGTFINGKRLAVGETIELPENASVRFGNIETVFEWEKPESSVASEIEKSIPPDLEAAESALPAPTAAEQPQLIESSSTEKVEKKLEPQKSVARSAGIVSIAVMGSRVMGLVREMVFANYFGAGFLYDAYLVGFRIPNILRDLFAEGALSAAFVKVFTDYQLKKSEAEAWQLASLVLNALAIVLSLVTILGIVLSPQLVGLIAGGFSPEKAALATTLTQIMFPFILLVAMAAVAMGVLNTKGRFGVPASASTAFNIVSLAAGLVFAYFLSGGGWEKSTDENLIPSVAAQWAIIGMAIGTLIGGAAQFVIQIPSLFAVGFRFSPKISFADEGVRRVMRLMAPAILGTSAVQINVLINTYFVSDIDGGQSWLSYSFRLMQFPIGVFGVAIGTAAIPTLSRFAAQNDFKKFRETISSSINLVFLLTLPSACGLVVLGEPIIRLIYERGLFTASDTTMTAWALTGYTIGLTGYAAIKILSPAFYALDDAKTPMIISLCSIIVNGIASYVFREALMPYGFGHVGVALATSSVALVNFFALAFLMRGRINGIEGGKILASFVKIAIAAAIMSAVSWFAYFFLHQTFGAANLIFKLIEVLIPIALGGICFIVVAKLLRVSELESAYNAFARKFGRKK